MDYSQKAKRSAAPSTRTELGALPPNVRQRRNLLLSVSHPPIHPTDPFLPSNATSVEKGGTWLRSAPTQRLTPCGSLLTDRESHTKKFKDKDGTSTDRLWCKKCEQDAPRQEPQVQSGGRRRCRGSCRSSRQRCPNYDTSAPGPQSSGSSSSFF